MIEEYRIMRVGSYLVDENDFLTTIILNKEKVYFTKSCSITNKIYKVIITTEEYNRWKEGELLQDISKHLKFNIEDRRFIICKLTPEEWKILFPEDKKK